jgi:phenylalanyl-tRNA synthetase beta chain
MLLGVSISPLQANTYLKRLGMDVSAMGDSLMVVPPSWRPDIVREEDLVEELGRVHGYELIPEAYPAGSTPLGGSHGKHLLTDKFREGLIRSGLTQVISHSLRDFHPLDGNSVRIAPRNPASPEHCVLRSSLLPGLADAAKRNGSKDIHLFEMGKVFYMFQGKYHESTSVSMISQGALFPVNRKGDKVPQADFYSLKAGLESAFESLGLQGQASYVPPTENQDPRFHPTRSAMVMFDGEFCGIVGQIHPDVASSSGLESDTVLCELQWDFLVENVTPELEIRNISRNPAVNRDIAILIDKSVPFEKVESAIRAGGGEVLEKQWLFDVFEGANIPEGKHSLGIGLQFRKQGNFTDEEANAVRDQIVAKLEALGAVLR